MGIKTKVEEMETIRIVLSSPEFVYTEILDREFVREVLVVEPIGTFNREFTGFVYAGESPSVITRRELNSLHTKELSKVHYEELSKRVEKLANEFEKFENESKVERTKRKEREELIKEREELTSRFWRERMFYIAIIISSISFLLTVLF